MASACPDLLDGGLDDRRGVADIGTLQCHRDNRAGLHVDGMLGFVRQMRAAIFHLRDLRIGNTLLQASTDRSGR